MKKSILYLSNATAPGLFRRLFQEGKIKTGHQMQKFNGMLMEGLAEHFDVTAVSPLPYAADSGPMERITEESGGVKYVALANTPGPLHKVMNLARLWVECCRVIRERRPDYILCDAIARSPCKVSIWLGRLFRVPTVGIVTDLPGMLSVENTKPLKNIRDMRKFDGYILLTQQMNSVVNPKGKPYMVMEGLCPDRLPVLRKKAEKRIVLYTGALWKKDAGLEYLTEGFLKAGIPNCELRFYGSGELVPWLREVERQNPTVRYMGSTTGDVIEREQAEAALLVNPRPSGEEFCRYSFPSKTMEYMASGTPVLMTRLPGVPEEYFPYVYLISREDSEGAAQALKAVLSQDGKTLASFGAKAREFVSREKNASRQTGRVAEFLEGRFAEKQHPIQRGRQL